MDNTQTMLTKISEKVGRLEAMNEQNMQGIKDLVGSIKELVVTIKDNNELAKQALQEARKAQSTIDKMKDEQTTQKRFILSIFKPLIISIILGVAGWFGWSLLNYINSKGGF